MALKVANRRARVNAADRHAAFAPDASLSVWLNFGIRFAFVPACDIFWPERWQRLFDETVF